MSVEDYYIEAKKHGHHSLVLFIDYLVNERKVLEFTDSSERITYYLQDKFHRHMNQYLDDYENRRRTNG